MLKIWRMADSQLFVPVWTAVMTFLVFSFIRWFNGKRLQLPPGPRPWPIVGNIFHLTKQPHKGLEELSKKYGPLLFLKLGSVPTVIACSPEMAKECLQGDLFSSRPPSLAGEILSFGHQSLGTAKPGPVLNLLRKICTVELFSPKRIVQFKDVRREEVAVQVLDILEQSKDGKPVLLDERMLEISNNNITRMLFSKTYGGMKKGVMGDAHAATNDFQELINETTALIMEPFPGNFIPFVKGLDLNGLKPRMWKVRQRWNEFLTGIIQDHRVRKESPRSTTGRQDFVDVLLSLQDKEKFSDDLIKALLRELILAGSDTSANQSTWTLAQLVRHPDVQKKLQMELDSVVGLGRLVDESDIPKLPYLQAVVKESFRRCPILPLLAPHESTNSEPAKLAGYEIPPKTRLFVNVYAILRDSSIWKDPLKFDPERFMSSSTDIRGQDFELLPFGSGRRVCPGLKVGLMLVQLTVAQLVHAFEWSLADSSHPEVMDEMDLYKGLIVCKPIPFKPVPRLPLDVYTRYLPQI